MKAKAQYSMKLERDEGGWWVASIPDVPGCHTQARTIAQAKERIREALGLFIGDAAEAVELVAKAELPASVRRAVEQSHRLRERADAEVTKAAEATREAAEELTNLGLSTRDAGELLGLSRQRVHQVLKAS